MKILFCIHSCSPDIGGPGETLRRIPELLKSWSHQPEILSLDSPSSNWVKDFPIPFHALGPGSTGYGFSTKMIPWLRKNLSRFDAVTVHGLWQFHGLAVRRALRSTAIPYFVYPHGMLNIWAKRNYPLKHLKKWFYWQAVEFAVLRDARAVLYTCEEERHLARQVFRRYSCNEIVVNYGSADPQSDLELNREKFLKKFPHLEGKKIVLFLGRLHEKKGIDLLLKAFARLLKSEPSRRTDNLHLVIVGPCHDPAYLDSLKTIAKKEFADRTGHDNFSQPITWTGMLQGDLKWGAMRSADCFILPSHQENFGIAVAEALSTGVPVLLSDKVNIWREIKNDKAGFIEEDTLAGCHRLLERYLEAEGNEWDGMRTNARSCFLNRFEITKAAESLLHVIEDGLDRQ